MFNIINIVNYPSEIKRASALSQPTVQPETTVQDVFTVNHCCDPDESPPETSGESNNPADETDIQQFGPKAKKQQNHYHSELCPVGPRSQRSGRSNPAQRNNHKSFFWGYRTKFIHTSSLLKYNCEVFVVYLHKKRQMCIRTLFSSFLSSDRPSQICVMTLSEPLDFCGLGRCI